MKPKEFDPIPVFEAKKHIEKGIKGEPTYNEELALRHADVKATKKMKEAYKKLQEVVPKHVAVKIIDVMPVDEETVKRILEHYDVDLEKAKDIMKIIGE